MNTSNQPKILELYLAGLEALAPNGKQVFEAMPTLGQCCQYQLAQVQRQLENQHGKQVVRSANER